MAKPKQRLKTETVGLRMSAKLRYGLELIARKRHTTLSALMVAAAEKLLEEEGLTERKQGKPYSLLDLLWRDNEADRKIALAMNAPELAAPEEVEESKSLFIVGSMLSAESGEDLLRRLKSLPSYRELILETKAKIEAGDSFYDTTITHNSNLAAEFKDGNELVDWLISRISESN